MDLWSQHWGGREQVGPRACWPGSLAMVNSSSTKNCLKKLKKALASINFLCVNTCIPVPEWRKEQLWELGLSLYNVGPEHWTQVLMFARRALYWKLPPQICLCYLILSQVIWRHSRGWSVVWTFEQSITNFNLLIRNWDFWLHIITRIYYFSFTLFLE